MPRNSTRPEIILALSQAAAARALNIRPEKIRDALDRGELVARRLDGKVRIPCFGPEGLYEWFERWPVAKRKVSQ